ncbi:hypothetical protein Tco_0649018 [Tanacetum coccineum]
MHTSKDDYLINSLRFVSAKESTQIYRAILPESKAYKTYLGYATSAVPPKMAQKFKKASPFKIDSDLVPVDEEHVQKGKRVKRHAKKSTTKPATSVVIREAPVETKSKKEAQMKEVRKKSLRDFHKTHPSGSGMVAKNPPSVDKITPTVTSEGTGDKPGVPNVTEDDSTESESESWGNDKDDSNNDQDSSNENSGQENESEEQVCNSEQEEESKDDDQEEEDDDVNKSDEESDDVIKGDKEIIQGGGTDAEMIDAQQGNVNLETTQEQVVEDAHVTIYTVTKKTEVPITKSSRSSDLASKFLNFLDIPHTDVEIVSPLDVHVHHEVPRTHAPTLLTILVFVITESSPVLTNIPQSSQTFTPSPILTTPTPLPTIETTNPLPTLLDFASVFRFNDRITSLEKEVAKLKKDPPHTQVTTLVDEHLDTRLGETREEFMNFLSESLTARIKEHVSSQPHSTYEAASTLTEFELKKILIDKMEKSESYLAALEHRDCYDSLKKSYDLDKDFFFSYDKRKQSKDAEPTTGPKKKDSTSGSSKGTKSQIKSSRKSVQSEEPVFEVADSDIPQDQEGNLGDNEDEPRNETASRRDWFKKPTPPQEPTDLDWYDFDELLDWENLEGGDYPFDLSKPLPLITCGKHQRVPFEYFINNDLKYLQREVSTMTYTTSTTKTKAAHYDLLGIEDNVPNIWNPVKVAYDRYALWGISHLREQHKSFYAYARGIQSRGDIYFEKRILAVTHVKRTSNVPVPVSEPPMLDRDDFVNHETMYSIVLSGYGEWGPERPRVYSDLSQDEKDSIMQTFGQQTSYFKVKLVMGEHRTEWGILVQVKLGSQDVAELQSQEEWVVLDKSSYWFLAGVTDKSLNGTQLKFMVKVYIREIPVYDEVGPSYDSDILSEAEAVKEAKTRPIKALTVYPPNTPVTLPQSASTKSQVKINIFTLRQLFSEFEKTCKKRITPTGIIEGERGFEQTKTCYLTEVIPFFKTLQEHFEGIQKALTKEVKKMSDAFDELEAELDQSIVDRKHDEIERKNLLIEHDNRITDGLSKEVFYVASNSELNVSRFNEMQKAHNVVKARCLELEAELSNLRDNIHKDNYNELLNRFSNLEINHLNLQLKYQNLKDSFQNKPSSPGNDTPTPRF